MSQKSKTKERVQERKKEQKRRQQLIALVGVVVVVILLGFLAVVSQAPAEAPIPADLEARYEGIPRGVNEQGFPRLGRADAKVQVVEYSSFTCPACREYHKTVFPVLLERVRREEIAITFVPVRIGAGNAEGAARTALCAQEQGKFWEMTEALFEWQGLYGVTNAFTTNRIRGGIAALSLDEAKFNACFQSGRTTDLLNLGFQGINATPTIRVNGAPVNPVLDEINAAIDRFAPFSTPASETSATEADATPEVTPAAETTPQAESTPES